MKYLICLAALLWAGMKLTAADNVKEVEIKGQAALPAQIHRHPAPGKAGKHQHTA